MSLSPRYVLEDFDIFNGKYLIEMKCFCDIPLSQITNHISTYGNYGIGLSKEFAYRNYINPVHYFHEYSDHMFRLMSVDLRNPSEWNSIIPYFKTMYCENKKDYYYNEREWRYVGETIDVSKKNAEEIENLKNVNNCKITKRLQIEYTDIKYIFIDNEDELESIINHILSLQIDYNLQLNLISKILNSKQLKEDF